jgi:hypothetical protein
MFMVLYSLTLRKKKETIGIVYLIVIKQIEYWKIALIYGGFFF